MNRFEGRVAIVTGGGGGIGAAVTARLVAEGARVTVADVLEDRAQAVAELHGDAALAVQFDAADAESVKALVARTVSHFGRLDILHNNAALTDPVLQGQDSTAVDIPIEIWEKTMSINATGYLLGAKYAIPHMIEGGRGSIINTASGSGILGDLVRIAYGSSKGAIIAMTRYIATQYGRNNIRCNTIAPGLIMTEASERNVPELVGPIKKHVLTTRLGRPEDIAYLVAFLASDEAGFITGQTISIDGGMGAHQAHYADFVSA